MSGTGLIGGRAFVDDDNDGLRDEFAAGINGIPDVEVSLYDCVTDRKLRVDRTNTNGFYRFSSLSGGSYYVAPELPEGHVFGKAWVAKRRSAPWLPGDHASHDDDEPRDLGERYARARRRGSTRLGGESGANTDNRPSQLSGNGSEYRSMGLEEHNRRRRGRRRLGTAGGPVGNSVEKSTIDPETGRTVTCISLDEGVETWEWGFGLLRASDRPSMQPTTSFAPTVVVSNSPSEMPSRAPSRTDVPVSITYDPTYSPWPTFGNPTTPSPSLETVPSMSPVVTTINNAVPSLTVSVVAVDASKVPSRMPSIPTVGGPSTNNLNSGSTASGNNNNFNEAVAKNNNSGSNSNSINANYIVGMTCAIAFVVLAAALLLYLRRPPKDDRGGPPTTILATKMDQDEISELHMSRLGLQRGVSRHQSDGSEVSEGRLSDVEEEEERSSYGNSRHGNSAQTTLSPTHSGDGSLVLSHIVELGWSSDSVDVEEAPLSRSESFAPSPLVRSVPRPRKHGKSLSEHGGKKLHGEEGPLSRSFPHSMMLENPPTISRARGVPTKRKGKKKMQNTPVSPTRSASSRSASSRSASSREGKTVKGKTIRSIERELISLTTALDGFPKDSQTWLLLNGYLDRAKEELEEAIGGLEQRAASNVAGRPQPYDTASVRNAPDNAGISHSAVTHHGDDKFVCGMELLFGGAHGKYTGQIDPRNRLPHGLGTFRKDDDGMMLEGEWHLGEFLNEIRTIEDGEGVVRVGEGGGRAPSIPPLPVASMPQKKKTTPDAPLRGKKKLAEIEGTGSRRRDELQETPPHFTVALLGRRSQPLPADAAVAPEERVEMIPPPGDVGVVLDSGARGRYAGRIDLESQLPHGRGIFRTDDGGTVLGGEWRFGELVEEIKTTEWRFGELLEEIKTGDGGAGAVGVSAEGGLGPSGPVAPSPQKSPRAEIGKTDGVDQAAPAPLTASLMGQPSPPISSGGGAGADAASEGRLEIIAPPGSLGLILEESSEGAVYVRGLDKSSPLIGQIRPNDKIVKIDNEDVWHMSPHVIDFLLNSEEGTNEQRKISVVRESANAVAPLEGPPEMAVDLYEEIDLYDEEMSIDVGSEDNLRTSTNSFGKSFLSHPDVDEIYNDMVFHYRDCESDSQLLFGDDEDELAEGSPSIPTIEPSDMQLISTDVSESGANGPAASV